MRDGIFITGTDTGVGKTTVAAALAAHTKGQGLAVGVMKPFHTGCRRSKDGAGRLIPEDAEVLQHAAGTNISSEWVTPYAFQTAAAPLIAARIEHRAIDLNKVVSRYRMLARGRDFMIVEGIGGVMVPLTTRSVVADLIRRLRLPVLLVARTALGTINHTLLTLKVLQAYKIPVIGVLMNETDPRRVPRQILEQNRAAIRRFQDVPVLGILPYQRALAPKDTRRLIRWIRKGADLSFLNRP